jgi:hypothetical protein
MIRYDLTCKKGHAFDGWFQSSDAFDKQAKRKLVACPRCGSHQVSKALMAPNVTTGRAKDRARAEARAAAASVADAPAPTHIQSAGLSAEQTEMLSLMRKLRREVEANAENVGPRFAEEARKMHYEEAPVRGIYGEASRNEVEGLHAEGIECYPLPMLPEDGN